MVRRLVNTANVSFIEVTNVKPNPIFFFNFHSVALEGSIFCRVNSIQKNVPLVFFRGGPLNAYGHLPTVDALTTTCLNAFRVPHSQRKIL
jgi:hypothetical protein